MRNSEQLIQIKKNGSPYVGAFSDIYNIKANETKSQILTMQTQIGT